LENIENMNDIDYIMIFSLMPITDISLRFSCEPCLSTDCSLSVFRQ